MKPDYKTQEILDELSDTLLGEYLGEGSTRTAYEIRHDKTKVLKVAKNVDGCHDNILEYRIWKDICNTEFSKYFAPIHGVSSSGMYLVMDKVDTDRSHKEYPIKIPVFFYDTKYTNYGFLNDNFVAIDYAMFNFTLALSSKTKKADWYDYRITS